MDDFRSKTSIIIFIIVLVLFVIGGFIYMNIYLNNLDNKEKTPENFTSVTNIKIDKEKDYIFFDANEYTLEKESIGYNHINFNFSGSDNIESEINNKIDEYKTSVKYSKDVTISPDVVLNENTEGIYSLSFIDFDIIEYENYLNLIIKDTDYDIINGYVAKDLNGYIFNIEDGSLFTEEEILSVYGNNIDTIKGQIRDKLNTLNLGEEQLIKVDETMNNLKYLVYINDIGKLEVQYLVKSTKNDYYDILVIE